MDFPPKALPRPWAIRGYHFARYALALGLLVYGSAKLTGAQFTSPDSLRERPLGALSGIELVWYFFGYSKAYGTLIALLQMAGALLVTFRRTALLGACVLLPIMANICLVDVFFGIHALGPAFLFLACSVAVVWAHRNELFDALWVRQNTVLAQAPGKRAWRGWLLRVSMLAVAVGGTYLVATYNNCRPSPIDGAWDVVSAQPAGAARVPRRIFFERNRWGLCVFESADNALTDHHFDVDSSARTVSIRGPDGAAVFEGHYRIQTQELTLEGQLEGAPTLLQLRQHR